MRRLDIGAASVTEAINFIVHSELDSLTVEVRCRKEFR